MSKRVPLSIKERRLKECERKRRQREALSDETKEVLRKKDREYQRKKRIDQKNSNLNQKVIERNRRLGRERTRKHRENKRRLLNCVVSQGSNEQSRKERGRKKVKRDRSSAYRSINYLTKKCTTLHKENSALKKKIYRMNQKKLTGSPNSKVKSMISDARGKITVNIERKLLLGEVFLNQLRKKHSEKSIKMKQKVSNLLYTKYIKKYRLCGEVSDLVSRKFIRGGKQVETLKKKFSLSRRECANVRKFLEEDENSRMCPGKKDHVKNVQKRVLLAPMPVLHQKYCNLFNSKMSLKTFRRIRPSYIVKPKISDRETCLCIKHANFEFLVEALYKNSIISSNNFRDISKSVCCDTNSQTCMYRTCKKCNFKKAFLIKEEDFTKPVSYFQWTRVSETRLIKEQQKKVNFLIKDKREGLLRDLFEDYNAQETKFFQHEFNRKYQSKIIKSIQDNLKNNEVLFRIDFSENVVCKYSNEVHGMHFGASKKQLSLHTGVKYLKDQEIIIKSFATVSEQLEHGAHAIWAHVKPIFKDIKPEINTLHIASDGPTAQYRNKHNFYLLTKLLPKMCPNITRCTWNFTESGHGKGPMDGVGGTLKREADNQVAHGMDINSVKQFVTVLEKSCPSITLIEVPKDEIEKLKPMCDANKKSIPQVLQMHQAVWDKSTPTLIYTRLLSCMKCPKNCSHYNLGNGFVDYGIQVTPSMI